MLIYCIMKRNLSQAVLSELFELFLKILIFFEFSTLSAAFPFVFKDFFVFRPSRALYIIYIL